MKRIVSLSTATLVATFASTGAYALSNRTFVSGTSSDTNPCSLSAPCRSFAGALAQTSPGGEIAVLDTADYGVVTITQRSASSTRRGSRLGSRSPRGTASRSTPARPMSSTCAGSPSSAPAATTGSSSLPAAGIAYEETPRPEGLPDDMQPLPGVGLRFLSISAIDGFRIAAALWQPLAKPATTLVVQVHGSGGNFASLPLRATARALSARGYAALSISTRQHDERVNTDNFFEVRRDIEAAVATAKALGYGSLVLQGHSLGTAQVAFYAATDWDPAIRGVILTGAIAKLPWKSRDILIQDEDAYRALAQAARDAVRAGRPEATLPMPMGWIGGRQAPVTARHFLTYRDEAASAADTTFWIARIPRPILLVRDAADGVVLPFEPYMLLSAARAEGSLVPEIRYVLLPNPRPPSLEGHIFADNTGPLAEAITSWLAERGL